MTCSTSLEGKRSDAKYCSKRCRDKRQRPAEYWASQHRRKTYGLRLAEYDAQLEAQDGKCAICGTTEPSTRGSGRFFIDHCHETGVVRGLLCQNCNSAIGYARDNVEVLAKAIDYLNTGGVWLA